MTLEFKYQLQISGLIPVVQKAIVPNLLETGWQYMHQITPDEFRMLQGNLTFGFAGRLSSGRKSDRIIENRKDPAVGNGNLMSIASKVFNGIAKAVKGLLNVGAPIHFIKAVFPLFPVIGITQLFTGRRECK